MEFHLMRKYLLALVLLGVMVPSPATFAAERTVTFTIENMTCVACPYIVQSSMSAVPGVTRVDVSFEAKTASVTFDDGKTNPDAIGAASTNAGYPAHLAQQGS